MAFEILLMVWGFLLFCFCFNLDILLCVILALIDKLVYLKKVLTFFETLAFRLLSYA